ncbi:unnamed protein product, partial [Urochloa humidicola]
VIVASEWIHLSVRSYPASLLPPFRRRRSPLPTLVAGHPVRRRRPSPLRTPVADRPFRRRRPSHLPSPASVLRNSLLRTPPPALACSVASWECRRRPSPLPTPAEAPRPCLRPPPQLAAHRTHHWNCRRGRRGWGEALCRASDFVVSRRLPPRPAAAPYPFGVSSGFHRKSSFLDESLLISWPLAVVGARSWMNRW